MTEPTPTPLPPSQVDELLGARPRSRTRRWVSLGLLLLTLGAAVALLLRFLEGNTTPYYMAPIVRGDLRPQVTLHGREQLAGEVTVRAPHDAVVTALPAASGAAVESGQALAVIDTSEFSRAIAADRMALAAARERVARADVDARLATTRLARFEKVWQESDGRVPSLGEMDAARAASAAGAATLRRQHLLAAAAQQRLDDDIERLGSALPRAPIAGRVVQQLADPGSRVQAGQALLVLAPTGAPGHVVVPLSDDVGALPPGLKARAVVAGAGDAERDATLLRIDTDLSGQRLAVFALAPDPSLPAAASASVKFTLPLRRHVLLVPNAALAFAPHCSTQREHSAICVLDHDGTARSVVVFPGPSDGKHTQILGGPVRPGQLAIIGWREAPTASTPQSQAQAPAR